MSVDETMGTRNVASFREECYTETIFNAGLLKKAIFDGRGSPEMQLMNFYSSFYQLWQITRGVMIVKNRMTKRADNGLDEKIKTWFDTKIVAGDRVEQARAISLQGIEYAEEWLKMISDAGVL